MPMQITFELSDSDLEHFRQVMISAREKSSSLDEATIIDNARQLLSHVWNSETSDFIRERMNRLETMIGMVTDKGWGLKIRIGSGGKGGSRFSLFSREL